MPVMDRISDMPDEILAHIMSFLTTKESVQTGILARRYRRTWASVPVLTLDLNEWIDKNDPRNSENRILCENKFNRFVDNVLKNRGESNLEIFRFTSSRYSEVLPRDILERVALLMPKVIIVSTDSATGVDVPNSVFSCASLQALHLDLLTTTDATILNPDLINLPLIRMLDLHGVHFEDNFFKKLFSGCPVLESLTLECCFLNNFDIYSTVLHKLTLNDCWHDKQMKICCPNLVSLVIESDDEQQKGIMLKNMAALASAEYRLEMNAFGTVNNAMNLLSGIPNVSALKLGLQCPEFMEILEMDMLTECKAFNNLRSLEIMHWDMCYDFGFVAYFLKHSPCLHTLTIHLNEAQGCYSSEDELTEDETVEADVADRSKEEETEKPVFQREYLETLKILNLGVHEAHLVNRLLIRKLFAGVKTIGNIC